MYLVDKRSTGYIASRLGVSVSTVNNRLAGLGVPIRSRSEANRNRPRKGNDICPDCGNTKVRTALRCRSCRFKHKIAQNPDRRCPYCGGLKSRRVKGCRRCHDKRRRELLKGTGNPNWKRGRTSIMFIVRQWTYDHWRPKIFERDGYTCKACGDSKGGNLVAHHIRPLAGIVREALSTMAAPISLEAATAHVLSQEAITTLDNGITLCRGCHSRNHGYKRQPTRCPESYFTEALGICL